MAAAAAAGGGVGSGHGVHLGCEKVYMRDSQLLKLETMVREILVDDKGQTYAKLEKTIFHPQGGGQPSDQGVLKLSGCGLCVRVVRVEKEGSATEFDIRHYLEGAAPADLASGAVVECEVDGDRRRVNARLHSTGHLIAALAERYVAGLKATGGHHFPGECRVVFDKTEMSEKEDSRPATKGGSKKGPEVDPRVELLRGVMEERLPEAIKANLPVHIHFADDGSRSVQMGEFPPVPCGGTHVSSLSELGEVKIRGVSTKSGQVIVKYE